MLVPPNCISRFPPLSCRHVQVNNESAIEFYKKFGFKIVETKEHYYKRIEPADAHVLQKTLRPTKTSLQNGVASDKERS